MLQKETSLARSRSSHCHDQLYGLDFIMLLNREVVDNGEVFDYEEEDAKYY